ncbi:MAG: hypothetical protein GY855_03735 [candidate division Zixibacteria bacterium]|nr:hypothetical protein [candidate division Zixibacteria bacterium]
MNKKVLIETAIRIYALYILVEIPMALWGLVTVFAVDQTQFIINPLLYQTWAIVCPFLYLIVSLLLLFKAESIARAIAGKNDEENNSLRENISKDSNLAIWITLLGIYLLVTHFSSAIGELIRSPITSIDHYTWSVLVSKGIVIAASFFMTFHSKKVEDIILKRSKTNC